MAKVCYNRAVGCRNTRLTPVHHRRVTMTAHVDNVPCICGKPECQIPYGLCHCGCGQKTNIATQNHTSQGLVKGTPHRYCKGHGRFKESIYPPVGLCICREPNCQIPHGLCHCGCGENTKYPRKQTDSQGSLEICQRSTSKIITLVVRVPISPMLNHSWAKAPGCRGSGRG